MTLVHPAGNVETEINVGFTRARCDERKNKKTISSRRYLLAISTVVNKSRDEKNR